MTLEQAIETIQEYSSKDVVITIQFNTDDEWADGSITPRGDPSNDLSSFSGSAFLADAIIALAEELENN
jgi:hypothetical protein